MSTKKYIEIVSNFRDRTRFQDPGYFEVPLSQTGRRGRYDSLDSVSLSSPIKTWTSRNFDVGTTNRTISLVVAAATNANPLGSTTTGSTFVVNVVAPATLQQIQDYYKNAVII